MAKTVLEEMNDSGASIHRHAVDSRKEAGMWGDSAAATVGKGARGDGTAAAPMDCSTLADLRRRSSGGDGASETRAVVSGTRAAQEAERAVTQTRARFAELELVLPSRRFSPSGGGIQSKVVDLAALCGQQLLQSH